MIIMTNNQWKCDTNLPAWQGKGEDCSAEGRIDGLVRAYCQVVPDVICLQEVSMHMEDLMMTRLRSIAWGEDRTARYDLITGGDTPLLYLCDRLDVKASGFFRYDEVVPGYQGSFNNSGTKSYTWAVFEEIGSGNRLAVTSTHLWWKSDDPSSSYYQENSETARAYQLSQAIAQTERVSAEYGCPAVIAGDLNSTDDAPCLKTARKLEWVDAYHVVRGRRDETSGYHTCGNNGYKRESPGSFKEAIDHILVRKDCSMTENNYLRITDPWFDRISDHYPLYIDISF